MSETTRPTNATSPSEKALPENEQELLDTALQESDQLLARSLHDDEVRRKRKRLAWLSALVVGGVVMFTLIIAILFGGFALSLPEAAEAKEKRPTRAAIERAEALAAEGWQLWKNRDLIAAAEKFEESVELNPKAANAWNGYGWALFNSGQSTKALRAFQKCVKLSPSHPAGLNGLGQLYLSRGEYKQAEKYLKKSAKNPHASAAWYGLARVYLLTGEYKKALPWAKKSAAAGSSDGLSQQMLAAAEAGELSDELRQMLEPLAALEGEDDLKGEKTVPTEDVAEPEAAQVEHNQGPSDKQWQTRLLALKEGGRWYEGANAGMELVRIPGDRPYEILKSNWLNIATSARKQILKGFTPGMMGNKEIHPSFFDVMHLGMTDPDADVRSYAATYIEMQGLPNFNDNAKGYAAWREAAIKDLTAEEIIDDENTALRGWSMFFGGRMKIAERLFRKALKDDPNNLSATNGLGFILLNQGDHEQAKPMFEKVLAKHKDAGGPMNGLARCLKAEGKVDEAIAMWEQAAKRNPGALDVFENLAQTYLERKEYAKSAKYFKILAKSQPNNKAIRDGLFAAVEGLLADE